jgi:hypothetical protein
LLQAAKNREKLPLSIIYQPAAAPNGWFWRVYGVYELFVAPKEVKIDLLTLLPSKENLFIIQKGK